MAEMEGRTVIECQQLAKHYDLEGEEPVVALRDLTMMGDKIEGAIKRGEFVVIRGPSGGGKTTFLNLLGTIDKPTNGALCIKLFNQGLMGRELKRATKIAR